MDTKALDRQINALEECATIVTTPCHDGELVFRRWIGPPEAETVMLVHGGSGSWLHWIRNISFLQQHFHVFAVDLPGLGDSASLPDGYTATDAVNVFVHGAKEITSERALHIIGFSWGSAVSAQAAVQLDTQSLLLVGPASLGDIPRREMMEPLIRRTSDMSDAEIYETNRENLARLMIYDRSKIDDLAVYTQTLNTQKARFNSRQFSRTRLVLDGIAQAQSPVKVAYGEFDAPALPDIAAKKDLFVAEREDLEFEIIPAGGHWLQYEQADRFNSMTLRWLASNSKASNSK